MLNIKNNVMKKLFVFIFALAILPGVFAQNVNTSKKITGIWKFEAPSAPYGYQKGTIVIEEKNDKLTGEVKFSDGYKIELKNIVFTGESLTFGLYVDYSYISVKAQVDAKNGMTGEAQTPEGVVKITAKKGNE